MYPYTSKDQNIKICQGYLTATIVMIKLSLGQIWRTIHMKNNDLIKQTDKPEVIAMLESIAEPAVLISRHYKILAANKAYENYYEITAQKIHHKHCYEVSHGYNRPCDEAGETCPLKNSLASQQPHRVLHIHHTPRGEEHVDVEMHPIHNDKHEILYFLETIKSSKVANCQAKQGSLIGRSPAFNYMIELIERVAPTEANVLLLGESGTGKEVTAQAIHKASKHAGSPFVPLECSGLTESLFESELFGHEKGAFTGANNRKIGLVEAAQHGTLFLDEIGDIPLSMQVKLLRLIESQTFRRVGSTEPQKADFRLICATHRDLPQMIKEGKFRQDLYYRISVFPIHLPSLKIRVEDVKTLSHYFLKIISPSRKYQLSTEALAYLEQYDFPGNIRELRNMLERACIMTDGDIIALEHLQNIHTPNDNHQKKEAFAFANSNNEIIPLEDLESRYLKSILTTSNEDKKTLATKLGLSERTLYRKLQQLR